MSKTSTAKREPETADVEAIKNEIMSLIQAYDDGLTEIELSRTMAKTPSALRAVAINALANEGKIQLCKQGSKLVYRVIDSKSTYNHSALQGHANISIEERAVFKVVESAGSKGIWNREIKNQTKLPLVQMSKVLKNLETKKLIKAVKSVTASKKKLYMLYDLEPDKSVTGGAWYSDNEFESEYVQVLHEQCYQFVRRRLVAAGEKGNFIDARTLSLVSSKEVKEYIDQLKISNVQLSLQDIEMVLDTIVFDGQIEKIEFERKQDFPVKSEKGLTSDEEDQEPKNLTYYYRALTKLVDSTGLMRVPCGQCPYIHECRSGAVINPEKCAYFERWFAT